MKQQINLVNSALLPPKPFFQFSSMMLSLLLILVVLVVSGVVFRQSLKSTEEGVAENQKRVTELQTQVQALQQKADARQKDPKLATELTNALADQQSLGKMLKVLQQGGLDGGAASSYAQYLYALASKPAGNVWLTEIDFHGPRVQLNGMALDAEDIPAYLNQLKTMPVFAGQRFENFELGRQDNTEVAQSGVMRPSALAFKLEPTPEDKVSP